MIHKTTEEGDQFIQDEFSSVGVLILIFKDNSLQYSTGVLIGPNLVLTATHPLYDSN